MDTLDLEKIEEISRRIDRLFSELESVRSELEKLTAAADEEPIDIDDIGPIDIDPIDIDIDPKDDCIDSMDMDDKDISMDGDDGPESEPVEHSDSLEQEDSIDLAQSQETTPVPQDAESAWENLFGEQVDPMADGGKVRRKSLKAIYQSATPAKAVLDALAGKAAWRTDMPGPEVRSLRSAIALGDQVVFINKLFRKDSALYQSTIDILNNTDKLSSAIDYLSETFPEWDLESDEVYRFMMAVRRKIRK